MEHKRIQKLLLSEYKDFSDTILVESPFAETRRDGRGLREVALGLTTTKFVIATDILKSNAEFLCPPDLDSSIETLELVSIYPLEDVTLSIFRRKQRKTLKTRLTDGRVNYYELGGMDRKELFWSLWCQQIQAILSQRENGSSLSEATVASSSSNSTLYFLSSNLDTEERNSTKGKEGDCRLWTHYGGAGDGISPSWTRKDIYLGPSYNELGPKHYAPLPIRFAETSLKHLRSELRFSPTKIISEESCNSRSLDNHSKLQRKRDRDHNNGLCDVIFTREHNYRSPFEHGDCGDSAQHHRRVRILENSPKTSLYKKYLSKSKTRKQLRESSNESDRTLVPKLSRFGFGIEEKCSSGLYLPPHKGGSIYPKRIKSAYVSMDPYELIESGVRMWEENNSRPSRPQAESKIKNLRRYGLATAAHFLYALGPWSVQPGDKISIQSRRSSSVVSIRRQAVDPELRLPVSRKQLAASVSMTSLEPGMSSLGSTRGRVVVFWTPEYWYRPKAATAAYRELRSHLKLVHDFRVDKEKGSQRNFFSKKYHGNENYEKIKTCNRATCILSKIFSSNDVKKKQKKKENHDRSTNQLRRLLKMNLRITAWDLDSTTIAKQLTLIDRDLFLRIPLTEIEMLIYGKSSRNAPNLGAWIAFSHRISCLTASEILTIQKLDMRTRIVARFINAANKCYSMGNFQSCRSILAALQSPPIYRLRSTWSYLKTHHATRYETMSKLCKIFKNPRTKSYKKAWMKAERCPPSMPYVGDVLIKVLGLDENSDSSLNKFSPTPSDRKQTIQRHWDSGSTFLTHGIEGKDYSVNCNKIKNKNHAIITVDSLEDKKSNEEAEWCSENKQGIVKRMVSIAMIKMRHGTPYSPIRSPRKNVFWAAKRLMLARKYYNRWQTFVMTAKIIAGSEMKKKYVDSKRKRTGDVTFWVIACQRHAQGYEFSGHSLAWEFLLKARYREDKENFIISRKLEPPLE